MNCSTNNRVYFRPSDGRKANCLQEYAYTCSETSSAYHRRLLGKRHFDLKKRARIEKEGFTYKYFKTPRKLQTLYNICMELVAFNLHHVDSFLGLPALIGEEIFKFALERNQFSMKEQQYESLKQILLLFLEAYQTEFLHSLNLSNRWKFLTFYLDEISILLPSLVNIKLSSCRIGDDHEILYGLGQLHHVKSIFLNSNELSDRGIKNLLEKRRRAKVGLEKLEVLDISENNKLTSQCLLYLVSLPSLKCVSVTLVNQSSTKLGNYNRVCPKQLDHIEDFKINFDTKHLAAGWGQGLVLYWLNEFETSEKEKGVGLEIKKQNTNQMSFYKKASAGNRYKRTTIVPDASHISENMTLCLCMKRNVTESSSTKRKAEIAKNTGAVSKKICLSSNRCLVSNLDHDRFDDILNLYKSSE